MPIRGKYHVGPIGRHLDIPTLEIKEVGVGNMALSWHSEALWVHAAILRHVIRGYRYQIRVGGDVPKESCIRISLQLLHMNRKVLKRRLVIGDFPSFQ